MSDELREAVAAVRRELHSPVGQHRLANLARELADKAAALLDERDGLRARVEADEPWNDAVDWLLNSRHTADPDIQAPFWARVDGLITSRELRDDKWTHRTIELREKKRDALSDHAGGTGATHPDEGTRLIDRVAQGIRAELVEVYEANEWSPESLHPPGHPYWREAAGRILGAGAGDTGEGAGA